MKRIFVLLITLSFMSQFSLAEEFKEIKPIEEKINIHINNTISKEDEIRLKIENDKIKGEQDAKKIEDIEKNILKKAISLDETPIVKEKKIKRDPNILDLEQKQTKNGKIYATSQDKPYTGAFGLYLGDFIEYKEEYVDGLLNGDKIWYSNSGNIVLQEHYKNNKIYGDQKAYYENGKIKSIVKYKNGKVVGIIDYDKNGKILHEDHFKNGTGTFKYFWENGNVSEIGRYKNWHKDGKWKRYNKDGSLDKVTTYKNGKQISEYWY